MKVNEKWCVFTKDEDHILMDLYHVSSLERSLRNEGVPYRTIYYRDNEPSTYVVGEGFRILTNEEVAEIMETVRPTNESEIEVTCVHPEGVLEVAKMLEAALSVKPPYVLAVKNDKGTHELEVTRDELLVHYINVAIEELYEYLNLPE